MVKDNEIFNSNFREERPINYTEDQLIKELKNYIKFRISKKYILNVKDDILKIVEGKKREFFKKSDFETIDKISQHFGNSFNWFNFRNEAEIIYFNNDLQEYILSTNEMENKLLYKSRFSEYQTSIRELFDLINKIFEKNYNKKYTRCSEVIKDLQDDDFINWYLEKRCKYEKCYHERIKETILSIEI